MIKLPKFNDDKRFSVYSGTYKCPKGTAIGNEPKRVG